MEAYHGTERQMALQRKVDRFAEWTRETLGACLIGRIMGCDDPDRLGWESVFDHFGEDGVFGMRLIPAERLGAIRARFAERDGKVDIWDVFRADAETIRAALANLPTDLPDGYRLTGPAECAGETAIRQLQTVMSANKVVPFSGAVLTGVHAPAALVAIAAADGTIAATAFAHLPHNDHSPHKGSAWGGLVAVDPAHRGRRLGVAVNAAMLRAAVDDLGAAEVYELVSAANEPSRRMVQRCGLSLDPSVFCGMANRGEGRFTS
jgi:RimJ/RimL family protein N-acetyltransferase